MTTIKTAVEFDAPAAFTAGAVPTGAIAAPVVTPRGDKKPKMTRAELDTSIAVIRQAESCRLEMWRAVTDIIDRGGHLQSGHKDIDAFFGATFGWSRGQASRIRLAYQYVHGNLALHALDERHVRELRLAKIPPAEAVKIIQELPKLPPVKALKKIAVDFNRVKTIGDPQPTPEDFAAVCNISQVDAFELLDRQPDRSLDLIFSDPEWKKIEYYGGIAERALRKLKPNGVLALMVGDEEYDQARDEIRRHFPIRTTVCYRTPGGSCRVYGTGISSGWKPIIVCGGDRNFYNYIESPAVDHSVHPWGLHPEGVAQIIDRLSPPGGRVLDCMCGGGSTAIGCLIAPTGLRYFVGGDLGFVADLVQGADPKLTWAEVATRRAAKKWAEIQARKQQEAA